MTLTKFPSSSLVSESIKIARAAFRLSPVCGGKADCDRDTSASEALWSALGNAVESRAELAPDVSLVAASESLGGTFLKNCVILEECIKASNDAVKTVKQWTKKI
jgi:hypothetical protein